VGSAQVRILLAGFLVAGAAVVVTLTGGALGVPEPWPVLLVAGAGLLVDVPRLRHALAFVAGVLGGTATVWLGAAVLPATTVGRAAATALGVLVLTAVTLATGGRLRLSMQLVGLGTTVALAGPAAAGIVTGGAPLVAVLASTAVTLLVAGGLGMLVAQVTQLVATGRVRGQGGSAAVAALAIGLAAVIPAGGARAAHADVADRGSVEHRQTVVRAHAADGTVVGGSVVTRLTLTGGDAVRVTLRDQAVRGLRSLSTLPGAGGTPSAAGAPIVTGTTVTHRLAPGADVRTVAQLDRDVPVDLEVLLALDGVPVTPAGLVGRSGRLTVTYVLRNRTVQEVELRHYDGRGRPRTTIRDAAVPFVGDLVVALDDRFRDVRSDDALVGDGTVHADVVLAAPVGAPVRTISWSADVHDAVVPPLRVRLVPLALSDTARGGVDLMVVDRAADALRAATDAAGLARTGVAALGVTTGPAGTPDGDLVASAAAILDGLLSAGALAGADLGELGALVASQDARVRAGDGSVHGLLGPSDVLVEPGTTPEPGAALPAPEVRTSVVYVLEVAGRTEDRGPGTAVRILLALGLLVAVGLLGREVGRLTGMTAG
jgi:hypothetical protein